MDQWNEANHWNEPDVPDRIRRLAKDVDGQIGERLKQVEEVEQYNQEKVIRAFQRHRVSDYHFADSTGYGYNDRGREVLDLVYADVFGAEAAIVRPHFVSGTHAIGVALFGLLRPGDGLLSITGRPYDTLHKVIGTEGDGRGSLRDFGIRYDEVDLLPDGSVDWDTVQRKATPATKVIAIQRSRGYQLRPSFTIAEIREMVERVRRIVPQAIIFADNCYGEFVETKEPTEVGVDLIAGSLIKNPGGGIVSTGGYIAGRREYVERAAWRLTAPGIGGEVGAMLGTTRSMFQGLFLAPHFVGQAVKGSIWSAALLERLGFAVHPGWRDARTDLIQAIRFDRPEQLIAFVQGIQQASPVDAHAVPEPSDMPGYSDPVIMAAGTFIQGGSLELSSDAPVREPYTAFLQGGLTFAHVKYAVLQTLQRMAEKQLL
jgi:cystathionine beta-lyase family protein involved in aluminum resistance